MISFKAFSIAAAIGIAGVAAGQVANMASGKTDAMPPADARNNAPISASGTGAEEKVATDATGTAMVVNETQSGSTDPGKASGASGTTNTNMGTSAIDMPEILTALATEKSNLDERKEQLDSREAELGLAEAAVMEHIARLEKLQATINGLVDGAEGDQNEDITRLVNIYMAMKPQQAGAIMDTMDIEVAVLVLAAMSENKAGPILASMSPVRAQAVSKIIFERSRLPGNQRLINIKLN